MSGLLRLSIGTHDVAGHAPDLGARCGWCARTVRSPRSADGPLRRRPVDPHLGQERCHGGRCVRSHDVERSRRGLVGAARFAPPLRSQSGGSRGMGRAPNAAPPCRWCRRGVCLGATGFLPVAEPLQPEEWGQPLFTENPHAPMYPASQQYTWVTSDIVVLQSISMRLPHQPGALGAEGVALTLASILGMENDRMHQAIELIDAEVAFVRLNPDEIVLDPVASPPSLEIRRDAEAEETVPTADTTSRAQPSEPMWAVPKWARSFRWRKHRGADSWTCWLLYGHWLIRPWQRTARPSRGFSRGSTHADVWLNSVLSDGSGYAKCVATGRSSGPPRAP